VDILWSDVSEYQPPVTDDYPYDVLAIRCDDGTYRDHNFAANHAWARRALNCGKLHVLIIYVVYRPNWQDALNTVKSMVGTPHPHTAFMIDIENWAGQITGDQSEGINHLYWGLADWIGDPRRVIGYGNVTDLNTLWRTKPPGIRHIVAGYGTNPDYPGKLGHQFTDGVYGGPLHVPPFGYADVNSADGYDLAAFKAALNIPTRKAVHEMIILPATAMPKDIHSDPSTWPERNWNIGWSTVGGRATISVSAQDWDGPDTGIRGRLHIASWIIWVITGPNTVKLVPVEDPLYTYTGQGHILHQHDLTPEYPAPDGAVGVTLNYSAPGGGYITVGRSG
jgi:hypothetical protein